MLIKKHYFTFFIICAFVVLSNAQSVFNAALISKLNDVTPSETIEVLVLVKPNTTIQSKKNSTIKYKVGNIYAITAVASAIQELAKQPNCTRIEYIQHRLQPMDDTALVRNRITDAHIGTIPLSQPYDGSGVLIGLIDTGIDFTHPDLKDVNGNSRVKYIWDMTKPIAVNTPTPFGYGQEWNHSQIDLGQANAHSDAAHYGHGTASAGIAAGNGNAINKHQGTAPKADIIMVALDFNKSGFIIADAVKYLVTKAQQLNMPLVINASVGDYYGSHDATDLESQLIDALVGNVNGRAMIASAGNGGRFKLHVGYNPTGLDTNFTWIKNSSAQLYTYEYSDTLQIKNVQYNIGVNNTAFHNLGSIGFKTYNYALNTLKSDTIYYNTQRIGIVESIASINSFGVYELFVKIKADSTNYLWRIEHTGNGRVDAWNFDHVTTNIPTVSQYPYISHYIKADTLQTICSGFQCSPHIITVGNYVNRNKYTDYNGIPRTTTEVAGKIAHNSSTGPTRQNNIKPDITASGNTLFAATEASFLVSTIASSPNNVLQGGYHMKAGGTSASAPLVTGAAALYFQKYPNATSSQLKQAIINCAYSDAFTSATLPNYQWGFGKLDVFNMLTCGDVPNNINTINHLNSLVSVYPNPFTEQTTLLFNTANEKEIFVYNIAGELLFQNTCMSNSYTLTRNKLASGMYFVVCKQGGLSQQLKIIVL